MKNRQNEKIISASAANNEYAILVLIAVLNWMLSSERNIRINEDNSSSNQPMSKTNVYKSPSHAKSPAPPGPRE